MSTAYAAFLRGINVGGHRKLPMAELRAALEGLGFIDVATYIASGNVVFVADETKRAALTTAIEDVIAHTWGYDDVPVVLRSHDELKAALAASPYLNTDVEPKSRFLALLSETPSAKVLVDVDGNALAPDVFTVDGDHAHVLLPNGAAKSKLTTNYLEKHLGVVVTLRNHNTIEKVISMTAERSYR